MATPLNISCKRIRLQADAAFIFSPIDLFTGDKPMVVRNSDFQFEAGLFFAKQILDKTNLASVTLEIRTPGAGNTAPDPTTSPLLAVVVNNASLNSPTEEAWEEGAAADATAILAFTAAQNNLAAGDYWVDLYALTTDGTAKPILFARGLICVIEGGSSYGGTPSLPVTNTVPNFPVYKNLITGYTGGGATNADGLALASYPVGTTIMLYINGRYSNWNVQLSTAATQVANDGGIIRGADSAAAPANAKCLVSG